MEGQAPLECELIEELIWSLDSEWPGQGSAKLSNFIRHASPSPSGMLLMVKYIYMRFCWAFFPVCASLLPESQLWPGVFVTIAPVRRVRGCYLLGQCKIYGLYAPVRPENCLVRPLPDGCVFLIFLRDLLMLTVICVEFTSASVLEGLLSCWVVLWAFGRAVGAKWAPSLYCIGNTLLQGMFCLGEIASGDLIAEISSVLQFIPFFRHDI